MGTFSLLEAIFSNFEEKKPHKLKYLKKLLNHFESASGFLIFIYKKW